ncbi:MAG: SMP-30/gluconolactonase/LRE family protein [Candidatus Solibacter usitatus]|nr:SMP-30/gluconolactonase/LRE family protein [Candidatus Solibacter usitatus]
MPTRRAILPLLASPLLAEDYKPGPDSHRQNGVPVGKITQHKWTSKIFPGTVRDYWIYVPAQYSASKPASVMVVQDGGGWVTDNGAFRAHIVMDNLIHKKDMPVTIGIFINPGVLPAASSDAQSRYNRSYEYDGLGDRYAQFLIEEILPEVGKSYNLSKDPNDYGIGGSSSGAIAAFTAAWHRPDVFRRVLSFIGSYTNLRGGTVYPSLIRKTEGKPLRVFLQDGTNDNNIYSGSWYNANQDMALGLEFAGYEHKFVVGTEAHNSKHGSAILPEALQWLWKDHGKPIAKPQPKGDRSFVKEIVDHNSDWEVVSTGYKFTEGPAVDKAGNVFFTDIPNNRIHKIALDGKVSVFKEDTGGANGLMFGPDGRLYACQNRRKRIAAYSMDGSESVIADGVSSNDIAINNKNEMYFTDPGAKRVWFIDSKGNKKVVHEGIEFPNGVRFSPDQSLLFVADYRGKWVWSFQVKPDGSLENGVPFYRLETTDADSVSLADGMTVDTEGYLYVTTRLGVQICDQPGRVVAILNKPHPGAISNAVFGGPDMHTLFVTAGDRVCKRRLHRKGTVAWAPVKPPQPRL